MEKSILRLAEWTLIALVVKLLNTINCGIANTRVGDNIIKYL